MNKTIELDDVDEEDAVAVVVVAPRWLVLIVFLSLLSAKTGEVQPKTSPGDNGFACGIDVWYDPYLSDSNKTFASISA